MPKIVRARASCWSTTASSSLTPRYPLIGWLFPDGSQDFATTVRRACGGAGDGWVAPQPNATLAAATPATREARLIELMDEGHDFYTATFLRVVGDCGGDPSDLLTLGRFESLIDDLDRFLTVARVALPEGAIERMRAQPPRNAARRRRCYRDYYDDELRDLVGESCEMLTQRFGYRF